MSEPVADQALADEPIVDYPGVHEEAMPPQPLSRRLRDPRTIVALVLPIVLLALLALSLRSLDLAELGQRIVSANPWFLVAAVAIYYSGFPLRGYRWQLLLRGAGTKIGLRDSTEIMFISWLVNCLVPAKLGDVYRAWLLKANFTVSLSRTFGTVFIERIFDLFAIALLGLGAAFWSFRKGGLPTNVQIVIGIGLAVILILSIGLYTVRNFGKRALVRLPVPKREKLLEFYERFEEGVFSIDRRRLPQLAVVTVLIWLTEAMRLYFVLEALDFGGHQIGISGAFFVALSASLLTAIPFTPAGLGIVELGVIGILTLIYPFTQTEAAAITLVDRAISVFSIWFSGGLIYALSRKTKANVARRAADTATVPGG